MCDYMRFPVSIKTEVLVLKVQTGEGQISTRYLISSNSKTIHVFKSYPMVRCTRTKNSQQFKVAEVFQNKLMRTED